jgi:hypothetical protein
LLTSAFSEANFAGYRPVPLKGWTGNFLNPVGQGEVDELLRVFKVEGSGPANSIRGYFVTDSNGDAIFAELDPLGAVIMALPGDQYSVLPRLMCGALC